MPGFDSPTELLKRQTKEILKVIDAIILLTNVNVRPYLVCTQLEDADNIYPLVAQALADNVRDKLGMAFIEKAHPNSRANINANFVKLTPTSSSSPTKAKFGANLKLCLSSLKLK